MKNKLALLMLIVFTVLLSSCNGYRETDSEYLISAVGFEKLEKGFCAYIEVLALSSAEKDTKSKVFSSEGQTPFEAVNNTTALLPRNAVFDHCAAAIVDDSISGKDLKKIMEYLYNTRNLNLGIYVFTSDDVEETLSLKSQAMTVGYDLMSIELNLYKNSGIKCSNKFYEIEGKKGGKGNFALPVVTGDEDRPSIVGYTVYKDYNPALKLSMNEAVFFDLIKCGSTGGEIDVNGKECRINYAYSSVKKSGEYLYMSIKIKYKYKNDNADDEISLQVKNIIYKLENSDALDVFGFEAVKGVKETEVKGQ